MSPPVSKLLLFRPDACVDATFLFSSPDVYIGTTMLFSSPDVYVWGREAAIPFFFSFSPWA
jgi:hypothetical protein